MGYRAFIFQKMAEPNRIPGTINTNNTLSFLVECGRANNVAVIIYNGANCPT